VETRVFRDRDDYLACLPGDLPHPFTNRALARKLGVPIGLAQKMTYTLEKAGWLERVGKDGNAHLFA
jgi:DNA-binding IclR family transcriptional regulator